MLPNLRMTFSHKSETYLTKKIQISNSDQFIEIFVETRKLYFCSLYNERLENRFLIKFESHRIEAGLSPHHRI